jgi:hypothetical protein
LIETTTTSPLLAKFPPSKIESEPSPLVNAPPWIQNITGFNLLEEVDCPGRKGVKMFKKRQSSCPWRSTWAQGDPKVSAEMAGGPVYSEE